LTRLLNSVKLRITLFNSVKGYERMVNQHKESELAVDAIGLIKVFGDNRAVDGVNLEVPEGSIYGVSRP
jgi:hypothetical protein